jgi:hypothetical protein
MAQRHASTTGAYLMERAESRISGPLPVPLLKRMCVITCRHAARARQLHCGVTMLSLCLLGENGGHGVGSVRALAPLHRQEQKVVCA